MSSDGADHSERSQLSTVAVNDLSCKSASLCPLQANFNSGDFDMS